MSDSLRVLEENALKERREESGEEGVGGGLTSAGQASDSFRLTFVSSCLNSG